MREASYLLVTLVVFLPVYFWARHAGNNELVVLSFPLGRTVASMFFIIIGNRYFRVPPLHPFSNMIIPFVAGPIVALVVRGAWNLLDLTNLASAKLTHLVAVWFSSDIDMSRLVAAVSILLIGGVYTLVFGLIAWYVPGLTREDKDQLIRFVPYGHKLLIKEAEPEDSA